MTQIRTKDKIFLAVAVPLALIGAYVWLVAMPAGKHIAALSAEHRALPDVEMFPTQKRRLEANIQAAEKELKEERTLTAAARRDDPAPKDAAARQAALIAKFTTAGAKVIRVENAKNTTDAAGAKALAALGYSPEARGFTIEARYPEFVAAMTAVSTEKTSMAVAESVSLQSDKRTCRWEMIWWL